MTTPLTIFGSTRLRRWYGHNYTAGTGVYVDESGHANTTQATAGLRPAAGTINGKVDVTQTGLAQKGLNCGGDDDFASTKLTIFCNVKVVTANVGAPQYILCKVGGGAAYGLGFNGSNTNISFFAVSAAAKASEDVAIANGVVHTYVGTYDSGATPTTKLYKDGVLQASTATNAGGIPAGNTDFVAMGCFMQAAGENNPQFSFPGEFSDVGAIADVPTVPELAALHTYLLGQAGLGPEIIDVSPTPISDNLVTTSSLIGSWAMSPGSISRALTASATLGGFGNVSASLNDNLVTTATLVGALPMSPNAIGLPLVQGDSAIIGIGYLL